jgi:tellurium resistance protein TerD
MPVSLKKGGNISLSKADTSLKKVLIGLGWDSRVTNGADYDLDASAFLLTNAGKVRSDNEMIFFNQLSSPCGSVVHTGDNRTGDGDGDDESIIVALDKVPAIVTKIAVTVTIDNAESRRQNFGQVSDAFIRIVNEESGVEICRFDLSEDYSTETAMIFGEVYRSNGEWKFKAVGQGFTGGLEEMCRQFGVNVS